MSSARQCLEWRLNNVTQLFVVLVFKKNLKLYLQPFGKYYLVGPFLTNCHMWLYGSLTTDYFGTVPPSMKEYVNNL